MPTLDELFKVQKGLDAHILEKQNLDSKSLIEHKILALNVEVGELANEWKGFKFWKVDVQMNYEKALEEFVDCVHFLLSLGNDLGFNDIEINQDYTNESAILTFNDVYADISELTQRIRNKMYDKDSTLRNDAEIVYERLFNRFIGLGENHLDFSWTVIIDAYYDKNKVNYERQEAGY